MTFPQALLAAMQQGTFLNWTGGNVLLTSPFNYAIPANTVLDGWGFTTNGAWIRPGVGFPAGADLITISSGANSNLSRFRFLHSNFDAGGLATNGLVLQSMPSSSSMYAGVIDVVGAKGFSGSAIKLYGGVFETDIRSVSANDCTRGIELRNPPFGVGNAVISSIKIYGGTYRKCRCGIATMADVQYQEPYGFSVLDAYFVENYGAGIWASNGCELISHSVFENNCQNVTEGADAAVMGSNNMVLVHCKAVTNRNPAPQKYMLNNYADGKTSLMLNCSLDNEGAGGLLKLGHLRGWYGGSTMVVGPGMDTAAFDIDAAGGQPGSPPTWKVVREQVA